MTSIPKLRHRSSVSKKAIGMPADEIPYLIAHVGGERIRETHNAASDGFFHEAKRIGGAVSSSDRTFRIIAAAISSRSLVACVSTDAFLFPQNVGIRNRLRIGLSNKLYEEFTGLLSTGNKLDCHSG
jgi:hypothetical protein